MNDPVGYIYDSTIYHPECLPEELDPDGEEVGAIPPWTDEDNETTCDGCGKRLLDDNSMFLGMR